MELRLSIAAVVLAVLGLGPTATEAADSFRDCPNCPEMVVVPPGQIVMGSPDSETTREGAPKENAAWEKPAHKVTIPKAFAVGKYSVTWAEFDAFAKDTRLESSGGCWVWDRNTHQTRLDDGKSWKDPGFPQADLTQPVVCVSWGEAQKYVEWLSGKTGQRYRLLSEAEWEYAARAGTRRADYWGNPIGKNNADCDGCGSQWDNKQTAPVGQLQTQCLWSLRHGWAMFFNGPVIAGTRGMMVRRPMAQCGQPARVLGVSSAAALGTSSPGLCARPCAPGSSPVTGTAVPASGWQGRSRRERFGKLRGHHT